ncbi:hypothetical protein ACFL2R_02570 [Patescibacteria group bacterium]
MTNILIKGSGDVTDKKMFFKFVTKRAPGNRIVIICGGGTKISKTLQKAGYEIAFDELGRRITKTSKERLIMKKTLEREKKRLESKFTQKNITIVPSFIYAGSILCPINGDDLVKAYELGFDEIFVFTKKDRIKKKRGIFQNLSKIKIIGI